MDTTTLTPTTNGWQEWGKHVLATLERLDKCIAEVRLEQDQRAAESARERTDIRLTMEREFGNVRRDIGMLQVRASMWGATAGGIVAALASIIVGLIKLRAGVP